MADEHCMNAKNLIPPVCRPRVVSAVLYIELRRVCACMRGMYIMLAGQVMAAVLGLLLKFTKVFARSSWWL